MKDTRCPQKTCSGPNKKLNSWKIWKKKLLKVFYKIVKLNPKKEIVRNYCKKLEKIQMQQLKSQLISGPDMNKLFVGTHYRWE